jgi:DNA primase
MDNVVGFSARALEKNQEPKYINTPDTPIYHKSSVLYGLNKAKTEVRKQLYSLIVEGQMDVVLSHQAGIKTAVASSGTALTENHLDILTRYSDNILFAFDQDEAGTQAAKRSIDMALARGISLKIVVLPPEFKDAGEAILNNPKVWIEAIKNAVPVVEWYFNKVFAQYKGDSYNSIDKKNIAKQLIPIMQKITDNIEKAHYIQHLAKKLSVPGRFIEEAVVKTKVTSPRVHESTSRSVEEYQEGKITTEDLLVILLLKFPQFLEKVVIDLDYKDFSQNSLAQKIYKFLQSCYTKTECDGNKDCKLNKQINVCLKKTLPLPVQKQLEELGLAIDRKYTAFDVDAVETEILECAKNIKGRKKEEIKEYYAAKISEAEKEGKIEKLKELMEEFQNIIGK